MPRERKWINADGKEESYWECNFRYTYPDGTKERIRRKSQHPTKRKCEDEEDAIKVDLLNKWKAGGRKITTKTFKAFADDTYFDQSKDNGNKSSTIDWKAEIFEHKLLPFFGDLPLSRVEEKIPEFIAQERKTITRLGKPPSASTLNGYLRNLSAMLHMAYDRKELTAPPRISMIVEGDRADRDADAPISDDEWLTEEEVDQTLAAAPHVKAERSDGTLLPGELFLMALIAVVAGLRVSEIIALKWDAVDLDVGQLLVRLRWYPKKGKSSPSAADCDCGCKGTLALPKGNRHRFVPLSERAVEALRAYRMKNLLRGPWVFSGADGKHRNNAWTEYWLDKLVEKSGVKKVGGWHIFRHTFASHLIMNGATPPYVQGLLGHATLKQTQRYAHLSTRVKREAVDRLPFGRR